MQVRIVNKSKHNLPEYSTIYSAGVDLRANIDEKIELKPLERKLIPTGLHIELPVGFEAQVRPRSGLALEKGLISMNIPGTIDADYRGEICVIIINLSNENVTIEDGERICQMVLAKYEQFEWSEVDNLQETKRGIGGFGHTGIK